MWREILPGKIRSQRILPINPPKCDYNLRVIYHPPFAPVSDKLVGAFQTYFEMNVTPHNYNIPENDPIVKGINENLSQIFIGLEKGGITSEVTLKRIGNNFEIECITETNKKYEKYSLIEHLKEVTTDGLQIFIKDLDELEKIL